MPMEGSYELCAECGMERTAWKGNEGQGYRLGGDLYCCKACAKGTGCTCGEEPIEPRETGSTRRIP